MIPELFLVFTGGLLGSAHCVGMCGGFALSIGASSTNWRRNFARQFVYSAGRIATYTSIGAIVAFAGLQLNRAVAEAVPVQSILALLAGGLLIVQGLLAAGVLRSSVAATQGACLMPRFLGAFLLAPGLSNAFFAGVFTGFLPCGLVYAFLALASTTQNMFAGWLTMLAFGLGTMPIMVLTGLGGGLLTFRARRRVFQIAGYCVVLAGVLSVARGVGFLESAAAAQSHHAHSATSDSSGAELPKCPCCRE